jgi:SNF family Na+-dependent transporter
MKCSTSISKGIPKSAGGWVVIAVLLLLLGAGSFIAYRGLTIDNVDVPTSGYIAMAFGVILSLIAGVGLMALIFYSSRKGYDESPTVVPEQREDDRSAGGGQMN